MKKILFVDDDTSLQRVYHQRLASEGFEVVSVANGNECLKLVSSDCPDLIVLDIMLPGSISGIDILETIKRDSNLKRIPIIMLSNLDTHMVKCLEMGASWYFIKANTSLDEVVKKIQSVTGA